MPARRMSGTYRDPQAAQAKLLAAREELTARSAAREELTAREEPMRRWSHPIPVSAPAAAPRPEERESADAMTQVLEKLQYQNQVLTDLLGAVNSLTAAVLCQKSGQ